MKVAQLRDLRPDEQQEKLSELQKQLYDLRCQSVTENMENKHAIRNVKKDIARIQTIVRQYQLSKR